MTRTMRPAWMWCVPLVWWWAGLAAQVWALDVPPLTGRVVDRAGVLPAAVQAQLTATLVEHERATGHQMAVLVIPSLEGEDLFTYSHRVATTWHLGQKGTDNGVLLLVALKDRKIRIEVGYGLEGTLTDVRSSQIIRYEIAPRFRAGDIPGGIAAGVDAVLKTVVGTYTPPAKIAPPAPPEEPLLSPLFAIVIGIVVGLVIAQVNPVVGGLAGSALAVSASLWVWPAVLAGGLTLAAITLLSPLLRASGQRAGRRRAEDSWWYSTHDGGWSAGSGGGWSGGGDSGFSGGGGDFGGGGASGDW